MPGKKILFVCIHNSARSQMAEAFVNILAPKHFIAESAGLEPGKLNPIVVKAMQEIDINISRNKTKSVFDLLKAGKTYDYVITVCDAASGEKCPVFPGQTTKKLHWGFPDPAALPGSEEEKLAGTRLIREKIKEQVKKFLNQETDADFHSHHKLKPRHCSYKKRSILHLP